VYDGQQVIYEERWIPNIDYFNQFDDKGHLVKFDGMKSAHHKDMKVKEVMLWTQLGDQRELHGRIPLEPILRDLRLLEDFRISRAVMNYERSKVLYVKTSPNGMGNKADKDTAKKSSSPKGGTQLTLRPGETYKMETASLNASDADTDGLLFLYAAGTGMSMPVYVLGVRADQQNYSAVKNTDSPFNQMIVEYGGLYTEKAKQLFKFVVQRNVEAGVLPEKIKIQRVAKEKKQHYIDTMDRAMMMLLQTQEVVVAPNPNNIGVNNNAPNMSQVQSIGAELKASMEEIEINTVDLPIEITLCDAIKPNPLELAKGWFIERNLSMVSSQTLSEKRGYTWSQEVMRMLTEKALGLYDVMKPTGGQQGSSNSGAGGANGGSGQTDTGDGTMNNNTK
jgi:hypothetical protein